MFATGAQTGGMHRPTAALGGVERVADTTGERLRDEFLGFLESFREEDALSSEAGSAQPSQARSAALPTYVQQLTEMRRDGGAVLYVDYAHVLRHSDVLAAAIAQAYYRFEPFMRAAVASLVARHASTYVRHAGSGAPRDFGVAFYGVGAAHRLRELTTQRIGQLLAISGTVTRTSEVRPELALGAFQCDVCGSVVRGVEQQFRYTEPTVCPNGLCMNRARWTLLPAASSFVNWQRIRVQENAAEIPPGSMPRALDVIVRDEAVERAKAGDRCAFVGTLVVVPDVGQLLGSLPGNRLDRGGAAGRRDGDASDAGVSGLRALGVRELSYRLAFVASTVSLSGGAGGRPLADDALTSGGEGTESPEALFTPAELDEIDAMRRTPALYERLVASVAPAIYGHAEVKTGILLMLFGGVHKTTPEGIRLRGDINVCIVGDPGTAKSQFLRYVAGLLPRAVYTSGKASSAAGLTAAVTKDEDTGDFTIEAGALMLADNGVCCIDEFDKMDLADQVAIHEAMEQQTISIAKAGIHASLNARTAVLAAANPVGGRYDRRRTLRQNVAMTAPIMSRFDLFFVVLDEGSDAADYAIARHILALHRTSILVENGAEEAPLTDAAPYAPDLLQRYIRYARTIRPRMTDAAARVLVEQYVALRQSDAAGAGASYRMTVRQLESMVRLAEAIARLHCDAQVREAYVREAARLLRASVIRVEADDVELSSSGTAGASRAWRAAAATLAAEQAQRDASAAETTAERMVLRFEDYTRISNAIVAQLRRIEALADDAESIDTAALGMHRDALVAWYLEQIEDEIRSEADYHARVRLVEAVVDRMVAHDGVLVAVDAADKASPPILVVHPNFAL